MDDPLRSSSAGLQQGSILSSASSAAVSKSVRVKGLAKIPSSSMTAAPPNDSGASDNACLSWQLPSSLDLHLGECLVSCPLAAQLVQQGTALPTSLQGGTLFLTNLRIMWEPAGLQPHVNGIAGSTAAEEAMCVISVHLSSIDKLRKLKVGSHVSLMDAVVVEVVQKYNARASMRLVLSEASYSTTKRSLELHIGVPATATDLRANVRRCYAVLHGNALGASSHSHRKTLTDAFKGWGAFNAEREFHRQGLNNPLSHWRVSLLNQNYTLCPTYPALLVVPRCCSHFYTTTAAALGTCSLSALLRIL